MENEQVSEQAYDGQIFLSLNYFLYQPIFDNLPESCQIIS